MREVIRIAMWSGPRNISTAMMRAWENRADCEVLDEPFYGAYLAETKLAHPMRDEVLACHPTDWSKCATGCVEGGRAPIHYQKHMCQHMVDAAPLNWMRHVRHAFLIRPPEAVAASFYKGWPDMAAEDLGFRRQAEIFDRVCDLAGDAPPVLEARDVLEDPGSVLARLCERLGVPFSERMLAWPAGRRESDGVWAEHWYKAVEQSTGFASYQPHAPAPKALEGIISECEPYYQKMRAHMV